MKPTTTIRWILVSLIVAFGISAAWVPLVGSLLAILEQSARHNGAIEQPMVTADGEPVRLHFSAQSYFSQQVVDLSGKSRTIDARELLQPMFMEFAQSPAFNSVLSWPQRLAATSDSGSPPIYWYLLHDGRPNGQAYGVGFHSLTKQNVGYFSRAGFSNEKPGRDQWFNIEGQYGLQGHVPVMSTLGREPLGSVNDHVLVLADGKLWSIDFDHRTVKVLASVPGMQELGAIWRIPEHRPARIDDERAPQASSTTPIRTVVRGPESFSIVDRKAGVLSTTPLPVEARRGGLAIFELPQQRFLLIHHGDNYQDRDFLWIDAKGNTERQKHVKLEQQSNLVSDPVMKNLLGVVLAPHLLGFATFCAIESSSSIQSAETSRNLASLWPALLIILVISTISAVAIYRRQSYFGLPRPAVWAVFGFVMGAPGWLAYRWHRVWPVLEACPACAEPAPQDRPACAECGAQFPAPALKGIEVYA